MDSEQPIEFQPVAMIVTVGLRTYSAWLTSIMLELAGGSD